MDEPRRKLGWGFWIAVLIGVPLVYVASFGPACWMALRTSESVSRSMLLPYIPLGFAGQAVPPMGEFLMWYANLFPVVEPAPIPASPPATTPAGDLPAKETRP